MEILDDHLNEPPEKPSIDSPEEFWNDKQGRLNAFILIVAILTIVLVYILKRVASDEIDGLTSVYRALKSITILLIAVNILFVVLRALDIRFNKKKDIRISGMLYWILQAGVNIYFIFEGKSLY